MIEYAVWYDWDIQHLYDLEHVWVHVSGDQVAAVEASFHGQRVPMDVTLTDGRPVLFAEPGQHAHWPDVAAMQTRSGPLIARMCGEEAGAGGVHLGNRFAAAGLIKASALDHRLATRKLQRDRFAPTWDFTLDSEAATLTPWTALETWIPRRVASLIADLPATVPHLRAVFLDCGDTLIDESTEEKIDGTEVVTRADEIPHAMAAVRDLHALGYPLALVADGPEATFRNLLEPRGIWALMQVHVISGNVGALKPDARMFDTAMRAMGLDDAQRGSVAMVGNNLSRDICGANDFGLVSLHVGWSQRRSHVPATPSEQPDYAITALDQLVPMIERIELELADV